MNIDVSQQISMYLHEQASLAIFLLAMLQEAIKHTGKHITLSAYPWIEISGSDASVTERRCCYNVYIFS